MPDEFLLLPSEDRKEILSSISITLGRAAIVLEKDVWVCWVLNAMSSIPRPLPMAFKGGTSLSKVFDAIGRFSEDIDITIDHQALGSGFDPFAIGVSKTKLKAFGETLKEKVRTHVREAVIPHFERLLGDQFGPGAVTVVSCDDDQGVRIQYPTALDERVGYIGDSVLVEFGGRNTTEPRELHEIRPYIADELSRLSFPTARVEVLSPVRTYWEKATRMHVECNRGIANARAERLARHWYDLYMLADHDIGKRALADRHILDDVVRHKKVFFPASYAKYDDCAAGRIQLVPDERSLAELRRDYLEMIKAGMFYWDPPKFDVLIGRLGELEKEINTGAPNTDGGIKSRR